MHSSVLFSLALGAIALASLDQAHETILILGAGGAGLAAAHGLEQKNFTDYMIIEAQVRARMNSRSLEHRSPTMHSRTFI